MTLEDFWTHVSRTDGCWLWTASVNSGGYGQLWVSGKIRLAHRVAWELTHGRIENRASFHGTCVCHRCDTPRCVRPGHLFLGTHQENLADAGRKGRMRGMSGVVGERHPKSKLTDTQRSEIRRLRGIQKQRETARDFGVSQGTVSKIQSIG